MVKLYVGNLPFKATEDEIRAFFAPAAQVSRVTIVVDKFTSRARGFGFVEIEDEAAATKAVETLNGRSMGDRPLKIDRAKPMEERGPR